MQPRALHAHCRSHQSCRSTRRPSAPPSSPKPSKPSLCLSYISATRPQSPRQALLLDLRSTLNLLSKAQFLDTDMLLRASPSLSLRSGFADAAMLGALGRPSAAPHSGSLLRLQQRRASVVPMAAAGKGRAITGVVFEPFEELKQELALVPTAPDLSLARQKYTDDSESAINEQINVEYNVSYVYHAMFAYFDRDNVALRGLAKFFKESSDEEREHAEKLMKYQNKRGGRVQLQSILRPLTEFDHPEKGDALYAMEVTLALEKLVNEKLLNLHSVASRCNDVQLLEFIESEFLKEQVEAIKKISEYVSQLRRVGKGHGTWHFDQVLLHEGDGVA